MVLVFYQRNIKLTDIHGNKKDIKAEREVLREKKGGQQDGAKGTREGNRRQMRAKYNICVYIPIHGICMKIYY